MVSCAETARRSRENAVPIANKAAQRRATWIAILHMSGLMGQELPIRDDQTGQGFMRWIELTQELRRL